MTRFPDDQDDPTRIRLESLDAIRDTCSAHGLELHSASDRTIVDDLWSNVAADMRASRYGIAFFEDRRARGINYNLTIEVGGKLARRRLALLKDVSIEWLPTDLVGKIYKSVDLDDLGATAGAIDLA